MKIEALVAALLLGTVASAHADLVISAKPTQNVTCSAGTCTATAQQAVLNVSDLAALLASGDVSVASASVAQDIEIDATLSWVSPNRLTLDAYRAISFKRPVTVAGTGALTITTNDGATGGDFVFSGRGHVVFWDLTSSLIINGDSYLLVKKLSDLRSLIGIPGHSVALADNYNAQKKGVYRKSPLKQLYGTLEGLGNVISNLSVSDPSRFDLVGLVGDNRGTIRDLGVTNETVSGNGDKNDVGGLAGWNEGTIQNCYTTGTVSTTGFNVGGLAGRNEDGAIIHSTRPPP